eukprot:403374179
MEKQQDNNQNTSSAIDQHQDKTELALSGSLQESKLLSGSGSNSDDQQQLSSLVMDSSGDGQHQQVSHVQEEDKKEVEEHTHTANNTQQQDLDTQQQIIDTHQQVIAQDSLQNQIDDQLIQSSITNDMVTSITEFQMNADSDVSVARYQTNIQLNQPSVSSQGQDRPNQARVLVDSQELPSGVILQPQLNSQVSFGINQSASRTHIIVSEDKKASLTPKAQREKKERQDAKYYMGYFKWQWEKYGFFTACKKFFWHRLRYNFFYSVFNGIGSAVGVFFFCRYVIKPYGFQMYV